MASKPSMSTKRSVATPSGRIAYVERGPGRSRLFVHGVLLNGYLWRHQLAELVATCGAASRSICWRTATPRSRRTRTCRSTANAHDAARSSSTRSGSTRSISSATTAAAASRRSSRRAIPSACAASTLTDCDAHDNWPPEAFKPFLAMAAAGGLRGALEAMLADKAVYRSPQALGPAYEHPEQVTDETIETYLRPLGAEPSSARATSSASSPPSTARTRVAVESAAAQA